jgi:hypothetical protein
MLIVSSTESEVGGVLMAAGLFIRASAFICSGEMAVAYFLFHARQSFWQAANQSDAAILFCFFFSICPSWPLVGSACGSGGLGHRANPILLRVLRKVGACHEEDSQCA